MATIIFVRTEHPGHTYLHKWETLTTTNDRGNNAEIPGAPDRTVQVIGNFGVGGDLLMQGSMDGVTWATLTDFQDADISFTAAGMKIIAETPLFIRPFLTAGDGATDLDVFLFSRGAI